MKPVLVIKIFAKQKERESYTQWQDHQWPLPEREGEREKKGEREREM